MALMHATYALVAPEVLMSRKFSSLSEQFPLSSKGGSFPRKKGGGGAHLARPLIPLKEKRMTIRELRKSASETIISYSSAILSICSEF